MEIEKQVRLDDIGTRKFKTRLISSDLTDISNPNLIIESVQLLVNNPEATHSDFSKTSRDFSRSKAFSRKLGLIEGDEPTNKARALLQLG